MAATDTKIAYAPVAAAERPKLSLKEHNMQTSLLIKEANQELAELASYRTEKIRALIRHIESKI